MFKKTRLAVFGKGSCEVLALVSHGKGISGRKIRSTLAESRKPLKEVTEYAVEVDPRVKPGNLYEFLGAINQGAEGVCSSVHCQGCLLECDKGVHCLNKGREVLPYMTAFQLGEIHSHNNANCVQCGLACGL